MRPDWDSYFMEMLEVIKKRSTCMRREVAAMIVKDHRIIATGYNGSPKGLKHCGELGCLRQELKIPSGQRHEMCRGIHAEQNAIIQAAVYGVSIEDSEIYITHSPCVVCSKMIVNAGIRRVVFRGDYPDQMSLDILKEAKIKVEKYIP